MDRKKKATTAPKGPRTKAPANAKAKSTTATFVVKIEIDEEALAARIGEALREGLGDLCARLRTPAAPKKS